MRIVTRPDFDGIVCAVLLRRAENIDTDILWTEPNEIQKGRVEIFKTDIMANLPYSSDCGMWFDHHISNKPKKDFIGAFEVAPSAAGVIYKYYKSKNKLDNHYDELILHTDIIDAADLNIDQVRYPENYPYILLSMTIQNHEYEDISYWNRLIDLLMTKDIDHVIADPEVKKRCHRVIKENTAFEKHLLTHTKVINKISITDFRPLDTIPEGNRFLTYSLFPEAIASIKLRFDGPEHKNVQLSIGHNIFQKACNVNIGNLLAGYGGGGHAGAGGCTLNAKTADKILENIFEIMFQNSLHATDPIDQ
ncbi:MAG: exopolyphosphatase [Desulfobacula sp.]|nr:exopolyphosphatase [Desulfobacula sp.]